MSFGSSKSKSSSSGSNWDFGNRIDPNQLPFLQNLWGQAQNMNAGGGAADAGWGGYNQAMGSLGQAGGYNQQAMGALGGQYMQGAQNTLQRLQNPGQDPMMDVYARQLGQNFNEQIMPGLKGDAMVGGGLGSSRAGIAQGLAGQRAQQNLQDFGAQLYGQNQDRALQAAGQAGNLQGMISQGYGQGAQMQGQLGEAYQNLGAFGMGIPWYNLQQLGGLLGGPVQQDLGGWGTTSSKSKSGGFNIGIS